MFRLLPNKSTHLCCRWYSKDIKLKQFGSLLTEMKKNIKIKTLKKALSPAYFALIVMMCVKTCNLKRIKQKLMLEKTDLILSK